jgi:hypothetical protein
MSSPDFPGRPRNVWNAPVLRGGRARLALWTKILGDHTRLPISSSWGIAIRLCWSDHRVPVIKSAEADLDPCARRAGRLRRSDAAPKRVRCSYRSLFS